MRYFVPALLLMLLLLTGCKKEIDSIGLNLQDDDLLNAVYVEIPLQAYSVLADSINTRNLQTNVVGAINDPVFGKTEAGFCTQFALSGANTILAYPTDGEAHEVSLDSVVLTMQYSGYFGDTLSPLNFEVYELGEKLDKAQYYSNDDNPLCQGANLVSSSAAVYPHPTTPVVLDTNKSAPHLRLRLSDDFGERLLRMDNASLVSTAAFQEVFNGLVIKAFASSTRGTGNLCYVSPTGATSGITLYYTMDGVSKRYKFPVSSNCVRYNYYTHDYSTASTDFQRQVLQHETQLGEQELYLQPTAGVKTRVNMPALVDSLGGKKVVINRAELVITNISSNEAYFFQPYNLSLQVEKNGTTSYLPDDASFTSSDYFGGIYDEKKKEYRFRITNYIQQLQRDGINDDGINIVVSGAGVRGNRLVFRGTDPSFADRLRVEVYYTAY